MDRNGKKEYVAVSNVDSPNPICEEGNIEDDLFDKLVKGCHYDPRST